jgi:hypothetical protein
MNVESLLANFAACGIELIPDNDSAAPCALRALPFASRKQRTQERTR